MTMGGGVAEGACGRGSLTWTQASQCSLGWGPQRVSAHDGAWAVGV